MIEHLARDHLTVEAASSPTELRPRPPPRCWRALPGLRAPVSVDRGAWPREGGAGTIRPRVVLRRRRGEIAIGTPLAGLRAPSRPRRREPGKARRRRDLGLGWSKVLAGHGSTLAVPARRLAVRLGPGMVTDRGVVTWEGPGEPIVLTLYGPDGEVAVPLLPKRALTLAQELLTRGVQAIKADQWDTPPL